MKKYLLVILLLVSACAYKHKELYSLPEDYLAIRQVETRHYNIQDEKEVLSAAVQVLQDLGYTIVESESNLGVLTANANREADNQGGQIALGVLFALSGQQPMIDTEQFISVTIVTRKDKHGVRVRVGFARIIYNSQPSMTRLEKITDKDIYQTFFAKLDQSIFLTGQAI